MSRRQLKPTKWQHEYANWRRKRAKGMRYTEIVAATLPHPQTGKRPSPATVRTVCDPVAREKKRDYVNAYGAARREVNRQRDREHRATFDGWFNGWKAHVRTAVANHIESGRAGYSRRHMTKQIAASESCPNVRALAYQCWRLNQSLPADTPLEDKWEIDHRLSKADSCILTADNLQLMTGRDNRAKSDYRII